MRAPISSHIKLYSTFFNRTSSHTTTLRLYQFTSVQGHHLNLNQKLHHQINSLKTTLTPARIHHFSTTQITMTDSSAPSAPPPTTTTAPSSSSTMPKLTLHYLNASRSHRLLWLLEELKLPYTVILYQRQSNKLAPPALKAIHPLGKAPVLVVDYPSGKSITLAETAAIVEFLLLHWGKDLVPRVSAEGATAGEETDSYVNYRYLMHSVEGSLMPFMVFTLVLQMLGGPDVPFLVRPVSRAIGAKIQSMFTEPNIRNYFGMLEDMVKNGGGDFVVGSSLTGADFMVEYPLGAAVDRKILTKEKYPSLFALVHRYYELPAYKAAVARIEKESGQEFSSSMKL